MFIHIVHGLQEYDDYFIMKKDRIGLAGFSFIQKCTAAIRCLTYGADTDIVDDYL